MRDNAEHSELPSPAHDSPDRPHPGAVLLLTPAQAAARLQVRESWLRAKVSARVVPCTFVGRHLRFSEQDLADIVAAGRTEPRRGRRNRRAP
ncbi:helix-turn-helix domain-containing protein [Yinghuangia sp. YIM S09857]|uniref:helix-turn-helix domain-containing protein n=1 Tax=Yinghuangia sp. YIM S09857 TaxID=3436929 RepID=UPI003F535CCD